MTLTTITPKSAGRAVAVAIAAAAPVVMAAAQAMVIRDRVVTVHPAWPPWAVAAMAVGFELAILTTGLAIVVTGHRDKWLIVSEGFLLLMSVTVAVTTVLGLPPWVLGLTIALVPLQYAAAFYGAHKLYSHWYGDVHETPISASVAPVLQSKSPPKSAVHKTPVPRRVATAGGSGVMAQDRAVAPLLGLTERGARDLRSKSDPRYVNALATLRGANGHAAAAGSGGEA